MAKRKAKPMKTHDPIKTAQENYQLNMAATKKFLFDVRCGGEPEIINDPVTGWELFMDGRGVIFSLEHSESAVNMILYNLAYHYRRLSAALGDPDQKCNRVSVEQLRCTDNTHKTVPTVPMTDERALRELDQAKRIIDKHLANGFVADVFVNSDDCFDFAYSVGRYAEIEANLSVDAA